MSAQVDLLLPVDGKDSASVVFLVFLLDGREHALPIESVVEVVRMVAVTRLPEAPPWVSGVINFRGRVISLIDVRLRLGVRRREPDLSTPIVVVKTREVVAGLVVDDVVDVVALRRGAVDPPGRASAVSAAVSGIARDGDRLIVVLEGERLCAGSSNVGLSSDMEEANEAGG